jgi:hypothetical protein
MTHRVSFVIAPAPPCATCGDPHTVRATAALWRDPEPGDLVCCLECNSVAVVLSGGALRPFTTADVNTYDSADLLHLTAAVLQMRALYSRRN